jgi:hypothetical protein
MPAKRHSDVNINIAGLSETALNIEDISNVEVLATGTAVVFAQKTETPFMVLSGNKDFYMAPNASDVDSETGLFVPTDTMVRVYKNTVLRLAHGVTATGTGSMNATTKDKFDMTAFAGVIEGVAFSKAAQEDLEFSAADVITANLFGAWLIQSTVAGVVSTKPAGGLDPQIFASAAEALDRLPAPDAANIALGYVLIDNGAGDFTCNTTEFDAAGVDSVTWGAYAANGHVIAAGPLAGTRGPGPAGERQWSRVGAIWAFDAPANNTIISIAEVW